MLDGNWRGLRSLISSAHYIRFHRRRESLPREVCVSSKHLQNIRVAVCRRPEQFRVTSGSGGAPEPCELGGLCRFCCPATGTASWSSYDFRVTSGSGGAIDASGSLPIVISDSAFRTNEAPKGASLSVSGATTLRISTTTIDMPGDESSSAVRTFASSVERCIGNPCQLGSQCTFKDFSTFCEGCGENKISTDGISCDACPPGTRPDDSHTQPVSSVRTWSLQHHRDLSLLPRRQNQLHRTERVSAVRPGVPPRSRSKCVRDMPARNAKP